jgi:hypothetical protein
MPQFLQITGLQPIVVHQLSLGKFFRSQQALPIDSRERFFGVRESVVLLSQEILYLIEELEVLHCYRLHFDYYSGEDLSRATVVVRRFLKKDQKRSLKDISARDRAFYKRLFSRSIADPGVTLRMDEYCRPYLDSLDADDTKGNQDSILDGVRRTQAGGMVIRKYFL